MEKAAFRFKTLRASLLIAGTTIGAGMLGIPAITAVCGFVPALIMTVSVWAFMLLTGLLLLEATMNLDKGANFLSLAGKYLGNMGKMVTGSLFIFLYYFLMIAYVAAGGPLLQQFLGGSVTSFLAPLVFCLLFGSIVARGPRSIDRVNFILTILMGGIWLALFYLGLGSVEFSRFSDRQYSTMLFAAPVLFSSFGYHNMIPSLTTYLDKDKKALQRSIVLGTTIPLVIYILWQFLIMGAVPSDLLNMAYSKGLPVTSVLQAATKSSAITIVGSVFAFFAISTSVLGVSFSLVDFLADGLKRSRLGNNRIWLTFLTFAPPLLCTWIDPAIFEKALGIAGGFGEALINGVIPIAFVWVARYFYKETDHVFVSGGKAMLFLLLTISAFVAFIEAYHLAIS